MVGLRANRKTTSRADERMAIGGRTAILSTASPRVATPSLPSRYRFTPRRLNGAPTIDRVGDQRRGKLHGLVVRTAGQKALNAHLAVAHHRTMTRPACILHQHVKPFVANFALRDAGDGHPA